MSTILLPYEQFQKDFEITEKLGEGKFGKVFCAQIRTTQNYLQKICPDHLGIISKVAAKFLMTSSASDKLRLRQEIDILTKVKHPNIVRLLMSYEDLDNFIQVFEYLSGGELLQRFKIQGSWPSEAQTKIFIKQICDALSYLAQISVAHLDLKPSNVIFEAEDRDIIKLIDFGFSKILESGREVRIIHGTPEFVSPEVVKNDPVSLATDLWSLGVLTFVLLSKLSPFLGATSKETYENICKGEYSLVEEPFELVSGKAKDFISRLLVIDQDNRMTASEALHHDWILNR